MRGEELREREHEWMEQEPFSHDMQMDHPLPPFPDWNLSPSPLAKEEWAALLVEHAGERGTEVRREYHHLHHHLHDEIYYLVV